MGQDLSKQDIMSTLLISYKHKIDIVHFKSDTNVACILFKGKAE
jgi:hypothetical protein